VQGLGGTEAPLVAYVRAVLAFITTTTARDGGRAPSEAKDHTRHAYSGDSCSVSVCALTLKRTLVF
jgi:hypothetical protein